MYHRKSPKQQNALAYGYKLRYIGAIKGLLTSSSGFTTPELSPFTFEEQNAIRQICDQAYHRAKQTYEDVRAKLAEASCGAEAEQRQYLGK